MCVYLNLQISNIIHKGINKKLVREKGKFLLAFIVYNGVSIN